MSTEKEVVLFQGTKIRRYWDEEKEKWFFSVSDVIAVLTGSPASMAYWRKLKERLKKEGSETVTKCHAFKMRAADGKMRLTDMADTETMFRLIQSVPSPKAEPFKLWLARVGYERVEEAADPELAIQRAMQFYLKRGYSRDWINMRLKSIEIRKALTDDITFAWAGLKTRDYKKLKGLKKENLRDNMTNLELVLNMLAEASTKEISQVKEPRTFPQNRKVARQGGGVAKKARRAIEQKTKKSVISRQNYLPGA